MAIKPCKECGKEVSTEAKVCPNCGKKHPTGGLTLPAKIFLIILLLGVIGEMLNTKDNSNKSSSSMEVTSSPAESPKEKAMRMIKVDYKWRTGGFGNVLIADFTITNPTEYQIKDIELTCVHYGKSGTKIDSNTRIIYDIVPAKGKKSFKNFNMGFIHTQAESSSVEVTNLKIME